MAIGDTVQAGLGRMDFSAFQTAGAAQARANEAFGNALGQAATAYFKGKEKKERTNEVAQYLIGQGASEEDAKAIAKNPFLQNEYQRKKEAESRENLARIGKSASVTDLLNKQKFEYAKQEQEKQKADSDTFITRIFSQRPTGELNEAGQDNFERGSLFLAPGPEAQEDYRNQLLENPEFQQTEPVMGMSGNKFLQQFAGESPAVQERALAFMQAEQKRLADLAPEPLDPFKVREELRKTEEYEQGQDAISFSPDRNSILLGDTSYGISGKFGNQAEVINLKSEAIPQYQNMNAVMNQLIELGEKRKNEVYMSNADKTLAASLSSQLQGLLREDILGPGTVTEPERQILEQIVQNPTTWMDTAGKTQDKINSLKGIRRNAFNKLKTRLTGLGLDVTEIGQSKSPAQNFDKQTSTGLGFTEIDLDQL